MATPKKSAAKAPDTSKAKASKAPAPKAAPAKAAKAPPAKAAKAAPDKGPAPTAPKALEGKAGKKPGKAEEEAPVPVPVRKMEKIAGRDTLCQIEIVKDGHVFIARTETDAGQKEYKNTVFEDLLTEMLITLQEQMADH